MAFLMKSMKGMCKSGAQETWTETGPANTNMYEVLVFASYSVSNSLDYLDDILIVRKLIKSNNTLTSFLRKEFMNLAGFFLNRFKFSVSNTILSAYGIC